VTTLSGRTVSSSRASLPQRPRSLNDCRAISVRRDTLLSPSGARNGRRAAFWQGRWGHHRLCGVAGATRTRDVLFRSGPAGRLVGREASAAAAWAKSRWATLQTLVPTSADTALAARFGSLDDTGVVHQVTLRQVLKRFEQLCYWVQGPTRWLQSSLRRVRRALGEW
jgi:hypothetical protein